MSFREKMHCVALVGPQFWVALTFRNDSLKKDNVIPAKAGIHNLT